MKKIKLESVLKKLDNNLNPYVKLIRFYELLGWDREKELDPTKVILNEKDLETLLKSEMENAEKFGLTPWEVGFLWLNKGPEGDDSVEEGMILLKDDWQM
ncbi:MAG: hypothetical protein PWQ34_1388 [Caldanaerobacter sp.]|uniref:hypothetical protein n=1 Tax=Caldanaerobacter sp. TaxID=2930036 RepID=UPI0024AAE849|nr:hypothetical protein [Caldanaerobacter sp.]MDI3519241.1 hypothetical protein [Caldanaerobacter sp.]